MVSPIDNKVETLFYSKPPCAPDTLHSADDTLCPTKPAGIDSNRTLGLFSRLLVSPDPILSVDGAVEVCILISTEGLDP